MFSILKRFIPSAIKDKLKDYIYKVIGFLSSILESAAKRYTTYHIRPIKTSGIKLESQEFDYSNFAIAMQGPLLLKNNFTLETLKLYKKYFQNALIILSTWEGEDEDSNIPF